MPKLKRELKETHFKNAIARLGGDENVALFVKDIADLVKEICVVRNQIIAIENEKSRTTDSERKNLLDKLIIELEFKLEGSYKESSKDCLLFKLDFAEATLRAVSQSVDISPAEFNSRVKQAFDALNLPEDVKKWVKVSLKEYGITNTTNGAV